MVVTTFWVVEVIEVVEVLVEVVVVTPLELAVDEAAEEEAEEAEEVELDPALVKVEIIPFPFTGWSVNTLRSPMGSYLQKDIGARGHGGRRSRERVHLIR